MVSSLGLLFVKFIGRKTSPQNSSTGSSLFIWIYVLANPVFTGIVESPLFDYLVPNHWHKVEERDRLGGTSGHLRFSGRCQLIIASGCWSKALLVPRNPVKLLLFPRRRSTVRRPRRLWVPRYPPTPPNLTPLGVGVGLSWCRPAAKVLKGGVHGRATRERGRALGSHSSILKFTIGSRRVGRWSIDRVHELGGDVFEVERGGVGANRVVAV